MKRNLFTVFLLLGIFLLFTSCSDMLSKIAEQSNLELSVTSSSVPNVTIDKGSSVSLSQDSNLTFNATIESDETLSYQWYLDGQKLDGATSASYTIDGSSLDIGTYELILCVLQGDGAEQLASTTITVYVVSADT